MKASAGGEPGAASAYLWTSARLMAGALLVSGAVRGLRRTTPPNRPLAIALGPTIGLLVVVVAVLGGAMRRGPEALPSAPLDTPAVAVLQIVAFGLYLAASLLFRRLYLRDRLVSHAFLAVGLVVAAFSQLHFAMNPVAEQPELVKHVIARGETLSGIAERYRVSSASIRRTNSLRSDSLRVGQVLTIPRS
jgi:hypothetical protein